MWPFVVLALLACGPRTAPRSIADRWAALDRAQAASEGADSVGRAAAIRRAYAETFGDLRGEYDATRASDADLVLLYRASEVAAFYTRDEDRVREMAARLRVLDQRRLATPDQHRSLHRMYIQSRMFAEAGQLAGKHPTLGLEEIPALREATELVEGGPTEWAVDPHERALLRRNVDLRGPSVVVIAHPRCRFSAAATRDIEADPVLGAAFAAHARWLAPQSGTLDVDILQQWNREHPRQQISLAFREVEWPMFASWATPTFYFLEDGNVRATVEGWPAAGRRAEVLAGLRRIGLAN